MAETAPAPAATPTTSAPAAPANGATAGAQNTPADQNATSRGLPYYEKLRRELRDTIAHKRAMDRSMVSAESLGALRVLLGSYQLVTTRSLRAEGIDGPLIHDTHTDRSDLTGPTRRPNLPLRTILPRRDNGGQHHQRLRQLHQRLIKRLKSRCIRA